MTPVFLARDRREQAQARSAPRRTRDRLTERSRFDGLSSN
jgi:hypothetical protein